MPRSQPKSAPDDNGWQALTQSLAAMGVTRAYLTKSVLPSWWEPEVVRTRMGFLETAGIIAKRVGFTLQSLIDGTPQWAAATGNVQFKKTAGVEACDVQVCQAVAQQAAELVACFTDEKQPSQLPSAQSLRTQLIEKAGSVVSLSSLTTWCWNSGIPVIHIRDLPTGKGCKKPHGMAVRTKSGRPVIVLCKNTKSPAWLIFILAHELGHIALDHITEQGVLVDASVLADTQDKSEEQANGYAVTLLTGMVDQGLYVRGKMYGPTLADASLLFGKTHRIDPGVVALNWGFHQKDYWTANAALNRLEDENALEIVQQIASSKLNWEEVSTDAAEWMERVAGIRQLA